MLYIIINVINDKLINIFELGTFIFPSTGNWFGANKLVQERVASPDFGRSIVEVEVAY